MYAGRERPHLATALTPEVGYDKAADIAKEAFKTDQTIREVAREQTDLSEEELGELFVTSKTTKVARYGLSNA